MVHDLIIESETGSYCHHHPVYQKSSQVTALSILVDEICHIHHQLSHCKRLEPSEHVNALFTKLVTICTHQYDEQTTLAVLRDTNVKDLLPMLQSLASQGEYFLELKWAKDLVYQSKEYKDSKPNLSRFIYYQNYEDLVKLELHALHGVGANLNNIVFVGSGPLPLSSILMYQTLPSGSTVVHNVDRDVESINISNQLLHKLGIAHGCKQYAMDAIHYSGYEQADVVVLGALVGQTVDEKMDIIKTIGNKMKSGTFLMARSAHSLRKLLYPCIEPHQVNECGFQTVLVLHPFNDVVNSILLAKKL